MSSTTGPLSRRSLLATMLAGSLAGGIWGTGFARMVQGSSPRLSVVGDDGWQVALLTSGRQRVLLCIGQFTASPAEAIDRVLGTLRPRIDILLMSPSASAMLGGAFAESHSVSASILLDEAMINSQLISGSRFTIDIVPVGPGTADAGTSWLANLDFGGPIVTVGPSLEAILGHATSDTTVAVAPVGDVNSFHGRWRSRTVVVNAASARDVVIPPPATEAILAGRPTGFLVRTFPQEVARFEGRSTNLTLPHWAQSLG